MFAEKLFELMQFDLSAHMYKYDNYYTVPSREVNFNASKETLVI